MRVVGRRRGSEGDGGLPELFQGVGVFWVFWETAVFDVEHGGGVG